MPPIGKVVVEVNPYAGRRHPGQSYKYAAGDGFRRYHLSREWCRTTTERYRMANFLAPVSILFDCDEFGEDPYNVILIIQIEARDRQTGRPAIFKQRTVHPHLADLSLYQLDDFVFDRVSEAILHEVMEAFHANGRRIFDPHVGEPGYVPEHAPPELPPWYRGHPDQFRELPPRASMTFGAYDHEAYNRDAERTRIEALYRADAVNTPTIGRRATLRQPSSRSTPAGPHAVKRFGPPTKFENKA